MKLTAEQSDQESLKAFGREACALLIKRDFARLANRFGYALAYGREPAAALEADSIGHLSSRILQHSELRTDIDVRYFETSRTGLLAVVECSVQTAGEGTMLLSLIVTRAGEDMYLTLEDIGSVAE